MRTNLIRASFNHAARDKLRTFNHAARDKLRILQL